MMPRVAILLGRCIWTRGGQGWCRRSFDGGSGITAPAIECLAEILGEESRERTVLVYEPEGIAHQSVEMPRVSRSVFASLAKIRSDHPVVMSERLGWGIEPPEPVQGGAFSTLLHSELTPGLASLRDACTRGRSQLVAAWPAYTAALASMGSCTPSSRAKFVLILTPEFVAVATCGGGRRSFKGWVGPMSDREWKAFSALIGDVEARTSPSMAEVVLRRGGIAVVSDGEPRRLCPLWGEIQASGRLEEVVGMDALASGAARIDANHPANLVEAFPRPFHLDRYLIGAASAGISVALALGANDLRLQAQLRAEKSRFSLREASLESRLSALAKNQAEMVGLRNEAPEESGLSHLGKHGALVGLAAEFPESLTLTALTIGRDDSFEIGAIVVGADFDPESLRHSLERCGFKPADLNGWAFDAASGKLMVRGKYGAPRA
jgi:hypothetical protein